MKLKSLYKFLAVLTLLVQFIMIPKISYADTNEREEIISGSQYKIVTALNNSSVVSLGFNKDNNLRAILSQDTGSVSRQRWKIYYYPSEQAYKIQIDTVAHQTLAWNPYYSDDDYLVRHGDTDSEDDRYYWIFEDAGDGYYYIKNKANPNKYLDVQGESTDDKTNIIAYEYQGNNNQKFKLQKTN
ncbi:hypothetical protein IEI_05801 [Bacillus wiedmannii]|uniref:RICIN domain-containing protein n=1 Tax=Bacillus wiedmannii TaxID=1890302 RepID=UPI000278BB1C|nr:RICIN domain-containing protein [Bacillus wiedmannii]EJQ38330.1 hypothetical protein IEI_05801 [Bacillus wiedmannii]